MYHPIVKTRVDLAGFFNEKGFKVGAEIGVCKGKFSGVLCRNIPNLKLYCVDTWESDPNDPGDYKDDNEGHYLFAKKLLKRFDTVFVRKTSMDAVKEFGDNSLDFVYIDANHSFDYVMQDIIEWSKKVRKGGIISGHDYYRLANFGVVTAVNAYVEAHKVDAYLTTEKPHSYLWEKK